MSHRRAERDDALRGGKEFRSPKRAVVTAANADVRPVRELKGFHRVSLQPHESKTIRFDLSSEDLAYWSTSKKGWTQEPSTFDFWVGEDSTASLQGTFNVAR
jgi:hypothetical protein